MTTRSLIVWGCTSGAGKSWLTTALCRAARRGGINVAPFKAQNMSNNARVVPGPDDSFGEIGTAQYLQALAAGVEPHVDMNPVLLKPERDTGSQVVLHGVAQAHLSRMGWHERSGVLAQAAQASFERLASRHELIVVEGAGSPAEINLAPQDYVNLGAARWAQRAGPTQALLVADIDRGGAFAHLHGTTQLLPDDLRPLLAGHVLNLFRGDPALLEPGPAQLQALTGVPLVAVIPQLANHGLPEEDGWWVPRSPPGASSSQRIVAVVAFPRISNLDEFAPLAQLTGWRLVWARQPADLAQADLIILPGSKQVSGDLAWLRDQGLSGPIAAHAAAGRPLLGICGGLQMLGRMLSDPEGHDGEPGHCNGLALLPLDTVYEGAKQVRLARFRFAAPFGPWQALSGRAAAGYEIHHGTTRQTLGEDPGLSAVLHDEQGHPVGWQCGSVMAWYAHGLFESHQVMQALFGTAPPDLEPIFDRLANHVERHFRPGALSQLLGG